MTYDQDRHAEMVDRIDEALSWEPGDPIHEVEYNSDWAGESYISQARCTDCDVSWEGKEQECWSCGKTVPKLTEWWKNIPGDDEVEDRSTLINDAMVHQPFLTDVWQGLASVPTPQSFVTYTRVDMEVISAAFRALGEQQSRLGDQLHAFVAAWQAFGRAYPRHITITAPRRYGLNGFRNLMSLHDEVVEMETSRDTERHIVYRDRVELLPPTPKLFNLDLGLEEAHLSKLPEVYELYIPVEIPTKQVPLPEPRPVLVPAHFSWDLTPQSFARAITTERRSRHI